MKGLATIVWRGFSIDQAVSPRAWLIDAYWPLTWLGLVAFAISHTVLGSPVHSEILGAFAAVNLGAWYLHRQGSSRAIAVHAFSLYGVLLWHTGSPAHIPGELGDPALHFATLALVPSLVVSSVYGKRCSIASATSAVVAMSVVGNAGDGAIIGEAWRELVVGAMLHVSVALAGSLIFYRLLTGLEETRALLRRAADVDPMTGLLNRRTLRSGFEEMAARARAEGATITVTMWDLDGLKMVNDQYGHMIGDGLIRHFARALERSVDPADRVYRIGGDEFAGIHVDLPDVEALRTRVTSRHRRISMGWADAENADLETALREADMRLYEAKRSKNAEVATIDLRREATENAGRSPIGLMAPASPSIDSPIV